MVLAVVPDVSFPANTGSVGASATVLALARAIHRALLIVKDYHVCALVDLFVIGEGPFKLKCAALAS